MSSSAMETDALAARLIVSRALSFSAFSMVSASRRFVVFVEPRNRLPRMANEYW